VVLGQLPQRRSPHEPIPGQLLILIVQLLNRQPDMIQLVILGLEISRLFQRQLVFRWLPGLFLDPLQHPVQHSPGEVCLWVWQLALIVRAGSLRQSQQTFGLQVIDEQATLPRWAGLNEVAGEDLGEREVFSRQILPCL
jgi:hypothetical protein